MGETLCGREGNRGPRGEYWQAPPGVHLCTDVTRVLRGNRKSAPTSTALRDHGATIALPIANFAYRYTSKKVKVKIAHTRLPSGDDPGSWQSACR